MGLSEEQKAIAFATLVPGAFYGIGYGMYFGTDTRQWFKDMKKPSWLSDNEAPYLVADGLTMVGAVVAGYNVALKGGFAKCESKTALQLYAATFLIGGTAAVYTVKKKNFGLNVWASIAFNALASATLIAFMSVDKKAGMLFFPFALWSGVGVLASIELARCNEK